MVQASFSGSMISDELLLEELLLDEGALLEDGTLLEDGSLEEITLLELDSLEELELEEDSLEETTLEDEELLEIDELLEGCSLLDVISSLEDDSLLGVSSLLLIWEVSLETVDDENDVEEILALVQPPTIKAEMTNKIDKACLSFIINRLYYKAYIVYIIINARQIRIYACVFAKIWDKLHFVWLLLTKITHHRFNMIDKSFV